MRDYSATEWLNALAAAGFTLMSVTARRVRLDFTSWVERMATPAPQVAAIRALQAQMADDVTRHFALEADGSFTIDTAAIEVRRDA